jgi:penicillin-binding protein 1C
VKRVAASSPAVATASARRRSVGLILRRTGGAASLAVLLLYVATVGMRAHFTSPPPTPIVYDQHGVFLAQFGDAAPGGGAPRVTYGYWPVDRLPQRVVAATLALEDRRFWSHPGVDPVAVLRATWQDIEGLARRSGASTIAMQVARMQHPEARTIWAKAVEVGTRWP